MHRGALADLGALIDAENAAILAGAFSQIAALSQRKAALVEQALSRPPPAAEIAQLAHKIQHNQRLLQAAIKGVGAAQARLAALRDVRDGLQIYDRSGQFANLPAPRPELEKKA